MENITLVSFVVYSSFCFARNVKTKNLNLYIY